MSRELKRTNPDRLKLENQCISAIAFGRNMNNDNRNDNRNGSENDEEDSQTTATTETNSSLGHNSSDDPLRSPLWILVINIVAMEMLRSKLPPGMFCFNVYTFWCILVHFGTF